jgi:hypothetical protein
LARLLTETTSGADTRATGQSFGDLIEQWYASWSGEWSPGTTKETRRLIDTKLTGRARVKLHKITPASLDAFYGDLRRQDVAIRAIRMAIEPRRHFRAVEDLSAAELAGIDGEERGLGENLPGLWEQRETYQRWAAERPEASAPPRSSRHRHRHPGRALG